MPSTVRATQSDVAIRKCTGAEAHPAGCARLPALYRGTRQSGRSRLTQLQNHVSWDGAEAGVLPASRLSSPAGSPPTGPFAGRVVPQSRPGAIGNSPAGTAPAPPFRHAFRKAIMRHLTGSTRPWNLLLGDHRPHRRILPCPTSSIFPFSCQMFERFLLEPTIGDCFWSYRRILVTDWVRRQRFELAI